MALYLVTQTMFHPKEAEVMRERLIDAPTKAAALRKVSDETISAAVAEAADIVRLTKAHVEIEKAE